MFIQKGVFIIQEYNLIKSVLSIGSNFIKPMIEKWHLNHQVDISLYILFH